MKRFYPIVISVFVLLFITAKSHAEEISITASVDKTTVERGDYIRYTIGIHGAFDTDQPQLPSIGDFSLQFGPSVSTQTSIVNNVVSIFSGYTYGLAPKRTGKITIGPSTLEYKGKTYKTNSIDIVAVDRTPFQGKVGAQRDKKIDASERVFVELTTDKKEAYIYEQIIMSFKLYFQKGLPIDDLNYVPATTKSFLAEKLGDERRYEEVRNGLLYSVVELRTALFPVVSGDLKIPPANFSCNIIIRQRRRGGSNSLFDEFLGRGQQRYPVERKTDTIRLRINPLPVEGKPKYFTGAVGTFTMDVLAKPTSVKVGDPITLSINISGTGNIQTMGEPVLRPESDG